MSLYDAFKDNKDVDCPRSRTAMNITTVTCIVFISMQAAMIAAHYKKRGTRTKLLSQL